MGADVFIGVSRPGLVTGEMVESMAKDPILLAMANPVPEIMPDIALAHGAAVVGTGRSDFPNQINNVLVFPGLFKGALSCGAVQITEGMKHAAARALADLVPPEQLSPTCILPSPQPGRGGGRGPRRRGGSPAHRACPVLIENGKPANQSFWFAGFVPIFSPLSVTSPRSHTAA